MNHQSSLSLSGKTILLVNTGSVKKRFVLQRMKKFGLKIVALNRTQNWAQPYVDHWILADTYNHSEAIQNIKVFLLKNPKVAINGAVTFWEDDIPLLARIRAEFKLIGNSVETSVFTRDKFKMQDRFQETGQPFIPSDILKSEKDLEQAIRSIGFPAVIKPVYGSDSQYVIMVNTPEEAREAYVYVFKNCTPDYDPIYKYNKRLFVYQRFVEGHEFSVECYVQHRVPHAIGIHEKTSMELPFFMETGDYIPPRISQEQGRLLKQTAEDALIVLGVENSVAHVELKMTKNGPQVIEVASRMGGDYTWKNVLEVYSFDLIRAACEIALGINVTQEIRPPRKYVMGKFFIPKNSGVITKLGGFDDIHKEKGVLDHLLSKEVGDSVLVPPDGYESIGWILTEGASYSEAEGYMNDVFEKLDVEVAPFKSYSSMGKTLRKSRFSVAQLHTARALRPSKIEKIRHMSKHDLRKLHVGIACNVYDGKVKSVEKDLMSTGLNIEKVLRERGYRVTFFDFNNVPQAFRELSSSDVDIVFNVCERINGSSLLEPHAASLFDILQVPYTGSNPFTLSLCIDKIRVKKLLAFHSIPTPKWDYAYTLQDPIREDLEYPLIVKPANTDNSIGITNDSVVTDRAGLRKQLRRVIEELNSPALIEEYIEGDEYDVSILGSDEHDLRVLPLSRSVFKNLPKGFWHIFPYEAKWTNKGFYDKYVMTQRPPKNIPKKLESLISEISLDTYNILDCHDYGRVEVRVDEEDNPYVLELNPNPSINPDDCVPEVSKLAGLDYGDFLEEILQMAITRYRNHPPYYHLQTTLL